MKKIIIVLGIAFMQMTVYAQLFNDSIVVNSNTKEINKTLIELDTIVGTEINNAERIKYGLFEFIDSSNYKSAQIFSLKDSMYLLKVIYTDKSFFDTVLSKSIIDYNRENIFYIEAYYKNLKKQKEEKSIKKETKKLTQQLSMNPPILKGKLLVMNTKNHKKLEIKKGKFYYFEIIKNKSNLCISYKPTGADKEYKHFRYLMVKYIFFQDSILYLESEDMKTQAFKVKFNEIKFIKQNKVLDAFWKPFTLRTSYGYFPLPNPLWPIFVLRNLLFRLKKFDLTTDSKFLIVTE